MCSKSALLQLLWRKPGKTDFIQLQPEETGFPETLIYVQDKVSPNLVLGMTYSSDPILINQ